MKLQKGLNGEIYEIGNIELAEKFFQSEIFQDATRDLEVRFALFIASDEPKGLGSLVLNGKQFPEAFSIMQFQMRIKKIPFPKLSERLKYNKKTTN